jgi:hypothetical protein
MGVARRRGENAGVNEAASTAFGAVVFAVGIELTRRWQLDGRWVKTDRFLGVVRNVLLAAALVFLIISVA